jgi:hypothetical protein
MEYTIKHNGKENLFLDTWEGGGVWMSLHGSRYHISTSLSREQAQAMLEALTQLLQEETA